MRASKLVAWVSGVVTMSAWSVAAVTSEPTAGHAATLGYIWFLPTLAAVLWTVLVDD